MRLIALTLMALALAGCATTSDPHYNAVVDASNSMVGLTSDDLKSCAGLPHNSQEGANYTVFTYKAIASSVMGYAGQCEMHFYISPDNIIEKVAYNGENPTGVYSGVEFCAPIVQPCMEQYFGADPIKEWGFVEFNKIENL